jgi:hypothetical protein
VDVEETPQQSPSKDVDVDRGTDINICKPQKTVVDAAANSLFGYLNQNNFKHPFLKYSIIK